MMRMAYRSLSVALLFPFATGCADLDEGSLNAGGQQAGGMSSEDGSASSDVQKGQSGKPGSSAGSNAGGSGSQGNGSDSLPLDGILDPTLKSKLTTIWNRLSYLPWEYAPDGCMARSFLTGAEFVAENIPVSQEVINLQWLYTENFRPKFSPINPFQSTKSPLLYKNSQIFWGYHVAAVLLPPLVSQPLILDRALESAPAPVPTWVSHANSEGIPKTTPTSNGLSQGYNEFTTPGSTFVFFSPDLHKPWTSLSSPDLKSFPAYKASDLAAACEILSKVFLCMGKETDPRVQTLVARTNAIASALSQKGLLTNWDGSAFACKPAEKFYCFDPFPTGGSNPTGGTVPPPAESIPSGSTSSGSASSGGSGNAPKVQVESSCDSQSFRLKLTASGSSNYLSQSAFSTCRQLADTLHGKTFPSGQSTVPTLNGGSTVHADCNSSYLTLRIRSGNSNSSQTTNVLSEAACVEMRDTINRAKL